MVTSRPTTPTPADELTPQLSSASPDTPSKKGRASPTILQTPVSRMKGYSRIGVGVRPDSGPLTDTMPSKVAPEVDDMLEMPKEVQGLGYGIELDANDQIDLGAMEMDRGEGSSSSSASIAVDQEDAMATNPVAVEEKEERDTEFPSTEVMQGMEERLSSTDLATADLVSMVKSLLVPSLETLPLLRDQLEAQRATIRTLQEQARLAGKLSEIERDRHAAERTGWHREMKALVSARDAEIAAGKRPRKGLDLDVGYHQELEASNKRLEMDNRLMAPRLADTQRQIDKLVNELRHLRSNVIMSTSTVAPTNLGPSGDHRRRTPSPTRATFNTTTMGDARTEHLLLAARKVRSMRAANPNVGMMTLAELKRHGVVGPEGGIGYMEGYGGLDSESDELESEEEEDRKPNIGRTAGVKGKSATTTPLLPRTKKGSKKTFPAPPTTPRSKKSGAQQQQQPLTTPGGSNFSDLLRAAELGMRPQTPSRDTGGASTSAAGLVPIPMSAMSATRTRMREESVSERGSPVKKARRVAEGEANEDERRIGFATETESRKADLPENQADPAGDEASALDLLAQASQLEVAQGSSPDADADADAEDDMFEIKAELLGPGEAEGHTRQSSSNSVLEPPIDLRPQFQSQSQSQSLGVPSASEYSNINGQTEPSVVRTPLNRPRKLSVHTPHQERETQHQYAQVPATDPPLGAFASPTGGTVPGLGKYVHLSNSMPARRVRSPYLKWTIEEDELLARAVAIHGEKWDLVSKGVPTRSYHQVRQRWLRKTGAFDKKLAAGQTTPGDHHGTSTLGPGPGHGLGYGMGMPLPPGMGMDVLEEDREGSPTPQSGLGGGRGKKRKGSIGVEE